MSDDSFDPSPTSWLPEVHASLDEEAVLDIFTRRVEEMLQHHLDILLSSLYRLDVEEHKIQTALQSTTVPPARGIARLILDRQKERLETRNRYRKEDDESW